jgi:hypothetical protein
MQSYASAFGGRSSFIRRVFSSVTKESMLFRNSSRSAGVIGLASVSSHPKRTRSFRPMMSRTSFSRSVDMGVTDRVSTKSHAAIRGRAYLGNREPRPEVRSFDRGPANRAGGRTRGARLPRSQTPLPTGVRSESCVKFAHLSTLASGDSACTTTGRLAAILVEGKDTPCPPRATGWQRDLD